MASVRYEIPRIRVPLDHCNISLYTISTWKSWIQKRMSQAGQEGGSSPTLENMQYSSKRAASGRAKSSKAIHFFSSSPQLLSSRTAYSWIHTKIDSRHRSTFEFQFWYPTRLDIIKKPISTSTISIQKEYKSFEHNPRNPTTQAFFDLPLPPAIPVYNWNADWASHNGVSHDNNNTL